MTHTHSGSTALAKARVGTGASPSCRGSRRRAWTRAGCWTGTARSGSTGATGTMPACTSFGGLGNAVCVCVVGLMIRQLVFTCLFIPQPQQRPAHNIPRYQLGGRHGPPPGAHRHRRQTHLHQPSGRLERLQQLAVCAASDAGPVPDDRDMVVRPRHGPRDAVGMMGIWKGAGERREPWFDRYRFISLVGVILCVY